MGSRKHNEADKVLIYLFGSLGDTIMAVPALRAVQRHFQNAELALLQNVQSGNVVTASEVIPDGLVGRYLSYSSEMAGGAKLRGFYQLWRELRRERFSAVVYLVISERPPRAVFRDKVFFRSCGIRDLIGFHALSKDQLYPVDNARRPGKTESEAIRKLNRLKGDGIEILPGKDLRLPFLTFSPDELAPIESWLAERRTDMSSQLIAIAPGCKTRSNIWPLGNFIEIGKRLIASGNCEIIVIGGKAEVELGEKMTAAWKEGINAAGDFSVRQSAALLSLCDAYIGLDTGTTHLAAAVGTRCFSIYGERNNPGHWFPAGAGHTLISHPVKCSGCRLFECPVPDHPCMTGISVESAWTHLTAFLSDGAQDDGGLTVVQI